MYQKVLLIGYLGKAPNLQYTSSGTAVCKFSLATSRSYKNRQDEWIDETEWHKITVWGPKAEAAGNRLTKGSLALIEGRIHCDSYDKDGVKRYTFEIIADNVRFIKGSVQEPANDDFEDPDEMPF